MPTFTTTINVEVEITYSVDKEIRQGEDARYPSDPYVDEVNYKLVETEAVDSDIDIYGRDVGPRFQEHPDGLSVLVDHGSHERSHAIAVSRFEIRTGIDQQPDVLGVSVLGGEQQRAVSVVCLSVYIGALLEK